MDALNEKIATFSLRSGSEKFLVSNWLTIVYLVDWSGSPKYLHYEWVDRIDRLHWESSVKCHPSQGNAIPTSSSLALEFPQASWSEWGGVEVSLMMLMKMHVLSFNPQIPKTFPTQNVAFGEIVFENKVCKVQIHWRHLIMHIEILESHLVHPNARFIKICWYNCSRFTLVR